MSKDRKPVLIIGAGVVGLVLAHGLKKVRLTKIQSLWTDFDTNH